MSAVMLTMQQDHAKEFAERMLRKTDNGHDDPRWPLAEEYVNLIREFGWPACV